jgi:hypothetical protein
MKEEGGKQVLGPVEDRTSFVQSLDTLMKAVGSRKLMVGGHSLVKSVNGKLIDKYESSCPVTTLALRKQMGLV